MISNVRLRSLRLSIPLFAAWLIPALPAPAKDFIESVQAWSARHEAAFNEANDLSLQGETSRANGMLLALAEKDGGPAAAFVIGNMLYRSDPAVSYKLHERAWKAFPREPVTALEMAMEQHRRGEHAAAIPNYRLALKSEMGAQFSALLAECLLRTGQLKEAVAAWEQARHGSNHTGIDFAVYEIHGELLPTERRGKLLAAIRAGDHAKLTKLIELDLHFDRDWWNESVFEKGLEPDLKLAAKQLGATDPRYQHLACYAGLARQEELKAGEIQSALAGVGLILGDKAALPVDSRLARLLVELVLRAKAATATDLLRSLSPELRARVARKDRDALHLHCLLAAQAEDLQLQEFDRIGWKEWQDPDFAVSYIAGLVRQKSLTRPDDPELLAAMKAVPDSGHLCGLRLQLAGEKGATRDLIVDAVKAEYHRLSVGMVIPDSYTLKSLFYALKEKL